MQCSAAYLVAHDPGEVLQQLVERAELLLAHGDHGALEELVAVDEELYFFGSFVLGNLKNTASLQTNKTDNNLNNNDLGLTHLYNTGPVALVPPSLPPRAEGRLSLDHVDRTLGYTHLGA